MWELYALDPQTLYINAGFWSAMSRGIGEPLMGCAAAALVNAIADAMGGHYFNRTPVVPDMIVNAIAKRPQSHKVLAANTQ